MMDNECKGGCEGVGGEPTMWATIIARLERWGTSCIQCLGQRFVRWARPLSPGLLEGALVDATRSKTDLIAANALLRQQLIVLRRQVKRPRVTSTDRLLLVVLARCARAWKDALLIVQPDTLLRWHRAGFRLVWRVKSKTAAQTLKIPSDTIALIRGMAADNRLWGVERIRGELLKLGIRVSKRTVQKYMRHARPRRTPNQTWATFLHNHAPDVWACDFVQVTDLCFRSLFAFFIVEHASRRVIHVGVTRHPTDAWMAQQLREATPFGEHPRFLLRDNDRTYGSTFARVAAISGIEVLTTPYRAPRVNALCERFLGSVRRECLDHMLILHERHLSRVLRAYVTYFNTARPHQGIGQHIPDGGRPARARALDPAPRTIVPVPILGGLHHDYRRVA
jgi:putative transposase